MNKLFSIYFCIILVSCQSSSVHHSKRRDITQYFTTTGAVQYFLGDIPQWANFSPSGNCRRDTTIRFLDFKKLTRSLALNYEQSVQLQYMVNKRFQEKRAETNSKVLLLHDEEFIFLNSADKIQAGIKSFQRPTYHTVHLVWVDSFLSEKDGISKLKKTLRSPAMVKGHPILLSLCLSHIGLEKFVKENDLEFLGARFIPAEMFSPFDVEGNLNNHFALDINALFDKKTKLKLFSHNKKVPISIVGTYEIQ